MKKIVLFLLTLCFSLPLFAANFQIRSLEIDAKLEKDASMNVREIITYDVGEINGILFDLDAKQNGPLSNLAIYSTDEDGNFQAIPADQVEISSEDELYHLKIYARTKNQIRKFALTYTLAGGAKIYNDIGEINRVFVGKNWQNTIDTVHVKIALPDSIPTNSIRAFGHGPLTGNVDIQPHLIQYELQNYSPGEFVEAHILFDPVGFEKVPATQRVFQNAKDRLLEAEKKMADEANAQREYYKNLQKQGNVFFTIQATFIILLAAFAKFVLRRAPKLKKEMPEYLRELPDDNTPAIVGKLFKKNSANLIFPTLMDLVRRKYLELETRGEEQYLILPSKNPTKGNLQGYEEKIKDIYIEDLGDGKEVNLSKLAKQEISTSVSAKIVKWDSSVKKEYEAKHFGVHRSAWRFPALLLCIFLILGSLIGVGRFEDSKFLLFIPILFIFLLPYILKSSFPNVETQETIKKWEAFKKFLSDYSLLSEAKITSVHVWEHYFVYALILGVADKVAKAYEIAVTQGYIGISEQEAFHYAPCLYMYRMQPNLGRVVQTSYHRSVSSIARSQRSSSSGFSGGGFSSGSSGGGGSRGGGGAF